MPSVKIDIDYSKCTTPFDCKKCSRICPQAVFICEPIKQVKFKETDAKASGTWKLRPYYRLKCTNCGQCLQVCPVDALKLTVK